MSRQLAGEISLSLSTIIYLVWLLPQLWHNFSRKTTYGLSYEFHIFLTLGYIFDFIYGFGLNMQWQYRLVTVVGLCSLLIQHLQFCLYKNAISKIRLLLTTLVVIFLIIFAAKAVFVTHYSLNFYVFWGAAANSCALIYLLPQILLHYQKKSVAGLSLWFICFSISLCSLDIISSYLLEWNWPSLVGAILGLNLNLLMLLQKFFYNHTSKVHSQQLCLNQIGKFDDN